MVTCTGSKAHLKKLTAVTEPLRGLRHKGFASEKSLYRDFDLQYMEPELREGNDEVERAQAGTPLPRLVTAKDIRGRNCTRTLCQATGQIPSKTWRKLHVNVVTNTSVSRIIPRV